MKKLYFTMFMAIALMLTACGNDEPNQTTSVQIIYHRVIDALNPLSTNITFSQSTCKFVFTDEASKTLQCDLILRTDENTVIEFSTPAMPMRTVDGEANTYEFSAGNVTSGGHSITELRGKINLYGPVYMEYLIDGRYQAYSTIQPYYSHTLTDTYQDDTLNKSTSKMRYGVSINKSTMKGILHLFNFQLTDGGEMFYMLEFRELDVVVTENGFKLTSETCIPYQRNNDIDNGERVDKYRASEVEVTVTEQGQALNGTITLGNDNETQMKLKGQFFEKNMTPTQP